MQIDTLAVRLRPRTPFEAADLGTRLCQHAWRDVFACYAVAAVPVLALVIAAFVTVSDAARNALARWIMPWREVDRFTFARVDKLPKDQLEQCLRLLFNEAADVANL